jgi:hypothetical protein
MDSIETERPAMSEAVRHLMAMTDETVSAKYIAPILHMSESVIVKYAKDGTWDQEHLGKYVISGNRVKFFRKDFLIKCGFMEPEPEKKTAEQLLEEIRDAAELIVDALCVLMNPKQRELFMQMVDKQELEKKTACAATPTD